MTKINICIFCYRDKSSASENRVNRENVILNQFVKVVQRYLGTSFQLAALNGDDNQVRLESCQDCLLVVESFCNLYHEWKCLEMRVEWQLKKLSEVMKCADKVSSRSESLAARFSTSSELLRSFRTELQQKCGYQFSISFPRILMKRPGVPVMKQDLCNGNNDESAANWFLGWISTLTAVIYLGNCSQESNMAFPQSIQQEEIVSDVVDYDTVQLVNMKNEVSLCHPLADGENVFASSEQQLVSSLEQNPNLQKNTHSLPQKRQRRGFQLHKFSCDRHKQQLASIYQFRCFRCNRNFKNLYQLQRHRRTFTHSLMRRNLLLKRKPIINVTKYCRQIEEVGDNTQPQIKEETCDSLVKVECDANSEANVGVLRPLQAATYKRHYVEEDSDDDLSSSSDSDDVSDNFDSMSTSSSDSKFSSSSQGEIPVPASKKRVRKPSQNKIPSHSKIIKTQKKSNTQKTRKKFVCKETSCKQKSFDFKEELDHHKTFHGHFKCSRCKVVKTYALHIAVHELLHSQRGPRKKKEENCVCLRCGHTARFRANYFTHFFNKHLQLKQLVMCPICKIFVDIFGARRHARECHETTSMDPTSVHKCDKDNNCSAYFLKKCQLLTHIRQAHGENPSLGNKTLYYCTKDPKCRRKFDTKLELDNHTKLHGKYSCSNCPVVKTYAPDLAIHEATHLPSSSKNVGKFTFACSRCDSKIVGKMQYINHFLETHLNLPLEGFTCPNCKERFPEKHKLQYHFKSFHNTKGIDEGQISRCDLCPATFPKPWLLILHNNKMHNQKSDILTCSDCGKRCKSNFVLRQHRQNKHNTKESEFPFPCDHPRCERRFEKVSQLEFHKNRVHNSKTNEETAFICETCGKKCGTKTALRVHVGVHKPKEKFPVVCEECGKVFRSKCLLKTHQLYHTGPATWKFCCLFCEKRCQNEHKLLEHLNTHTNEKPFSCEYCGAEYAHRHNLRNHKNKAHDANDIPRKHQYVNPRVSRKGVKVKRIPNCNEK